MIRITASKNLPLLRYRGTEAVDQAASEVRARFATATKHQIYADKRNEAERFLTAVESGTEPDASQYPYLSAETGLSAATMLDLAYMWLAMDAAWKGVAALIEQITIDAKIRISEANDEAAISSIAAETRSTLEALGQKPPSPPNRTPIFPPSYIRA
jgi:hypothetical protein